MRSNNCSNKAHKLFNEPHAERCDTPLEIQQTDQHLKINNGK